MKSSLFRTLPLAIAAAALALTSSGTAEAPSIGQPVPLKFQSVQGHRVDLASMKGKVVLIDFWATWCGPCVAEIPNVKEAYDKLNPQGFEIIGISLDSDKGRLQSFIQKNGMKWPQFFDGKGWKNEISSKFDIHSIPAMWLVDKKGNLVDTNARQDLEGKVKKLLAE